MPTDSASISELSRQLGIARATVRKALLLGMPRDPAAAAAWRLANVDHERSARAKSSRPGSAAERSAGLVASRMRKIEIEARLAELDLLERKGVLVSAEAVRREYGRRLSDLRDSLLQLAPRIGPMVAAESDLTTVERIIEDAVVEIMEAAIAR